MSRDQHDPRPEFDDWPVKEEDPGDVQWIGVHGTQGHMFFNKSTEGIFAAEADQDAATFAKIEGSEQEKEEGKSLGERIEEIGEEHEWEALSEFAREHLGAESEEESESDDEA